MSHFLLFIPRPGRPASGEKVVDLEILYASPTSMGLEMCRRLGVAELWRWTKGRIEVHRLVAGEYELIDRSAIFPALDLSLLERLCVCTFQPTAVRELRQALRAATP
jgi:hypothetical protein